MAAEDERLRHFGVVPAIEPADEEGADDGAAQLDRINRERRDLEAGMREQAEAIMGTVGNGFVPTAAPKPSFGGPPQFGG